MVACPFVAAEPDTKLTLTKTEDGFQITGTNQKQSEKELQAGHRAISIEVKRADEFERHQKVQVAIDMQEEPILARVLNHTYGKCGWCATQGESKEDKCTHDNEATGLVLEVTPKDALRIHQAYSNKLNVEIKKM